MISYGHGSHQQNLNPKRKESKDWKSLPDDYWVLVQDGKVIKSGKGKPRFTSSRGQELMTVKYAKKMRIKIQ